MSTDLRTALAERLSPHFTLSKSRLMTLAVMIVALANGRTVNLSHIASAFPGPAQHASNYRRLQRFFQHVRLDQKIVAWIVVKMLNLERPKCLALDRTNWKIGGKDVNLLVLALVTRRFRIPLFWVLLDHQGNSNTDQRIKLMQRYLELFDASSIELLLADREFIGGKWMNFLINNNIPFAIRVKVGMRFSPSDGKFFSISSLLRKKRARRKPVVLKGRLPDCEAVLSIAAKQLKSGEWLIVMTNTDDPAKTLNAYRKRWSIECLFGDAKTRGFNLEDTRLTNPDKLDTLMAIVALAMVWAYRCATKVMGMKAIKRKTHGRRERSWFRIGLDALRNWIEHNPDKASRAWQKTWPRA